MTTTDQETGTDTDETSSEITDTDTAAEAGNEVAVETALFDLAGASNDVAPAEEGESAEVLEPAEEGDSAEAIESSEVVEAAESVEPDETDEPVETDELVEPVEEIDPEEVARREVLALDNARRSIEAIVLVTQDPVEPGVLAELTGLGVEQIEDLCDELADWYLEHDRGFELVRVGGGYRFQTHSDQAEVVKQFVLDGQSGKLSAAALETLAIVAYKQPVSRAQIAAIRGVGVDGVMRTLQQRGYIEEIARDPGPGQAVLYGTTRAFLEKMGLDDLDELPSLGDFVPAPEVLEALEHSLRISPEGDSTRDSADSDSVDNNSADSDSANSDRSDDDTNDHDQVAEVSTMPTPDRSDHPSNTDEIVDGPVAEVIDLRDHGRHHQTP